MALVVRSLSIGSWETVEGQQLVSASSKLTTTLGASFFHFEINPLRFVGFFHDSA